LWFYASRGACAADRDAVRSSCGVSVRAPGSAHSR
jgi:hypothetical protein